MNGDIANAIQQTSDGGYVVAGQSASFGSGQYDSDFWVLKLDALGEIIFNPISGAIISDTSVTPNDTLATVINTSASIQDTNVTPRDTSATVTDTNAIVTQQAP